MPTTGPNLPSAAASLANAGTNENANAWATPANIYGAGTASITAATFDSPDVGEILVASGFGFSVTGSVLGITVVINKRGFTSANSGKDFRVQLATGTAFANLVGDNKASASVWPQTTLADTTYGGAADTWNAGLSAAQVNASTFAVFVSAYANVANADVEIDSITVTVTTSAATSANATTATATGAANADTGKVAAGGTGASAGTGAALAAVGQPGRLATTTLAAATGLGLDATVDITAGAITFDADVATGTAAAIIAHMNLATVAGYAQGRSA